MLHDRLGSNITYLYAEHTAPPSLFSTHNGAKTGPLVEIHIEYRTIYKEFAETHIKRPKDVDVWVF